MPTQSQLKSFIDNFLLDASKRCFRYAVILEYNKIPVWSGAAQASTQTGFDITFPISTKAKAGDGTSLGLEKGQYTLGINNGKLDLGFESGLPYFEFLDDNPGRSKTSPWKFKDSMWKQFDERFNFIVESEYREKLTNFLGQ